MRVHRPYLEYPQSSPGVSERSKALCSGVAAEVLRFRVGCPQGAHRKAPRTRGALSTHLQSQGITACPPQLIQSVGRTPDRGTYSHRTLDHPTRPPNANPIVVAGGLGFLVSRPASAPRVSADYERRPLQSRPLFTDS